MREVAYLSLIFTDDPDLPADSVATPAAAAAATSSARTTATGAAGRGRPKRTGRQ